MDVREFLENRTDVQDADAGEVLINCPFHGETNPSLSVNLAKGVFHCFSCKESGPFAKLIAEFDGISFDKAKAMLEVGEGDEVMLKAMMRTLEGYAEEEKAGPKRFSIKAFHKFFPPVGPKGLNYLEGRGISRETAERFDLRWGESGVMQGRVVFPIYDSYGKLLSYGGRTVSDQKPKTRKARSGLDTLYGLRELLKAEGEHYQPFPCIIMVEGEFDAMYLQQHGYAAVSTMGTAALTPHQKLLLKTFAKLVVWSYDGDDAGRNAQVKAIDTTRRFMSTVSIKLPEGRDPNNLSEKEIERLYGGLK